MRSCCHDDNAFADKNAIAVIMLQLLSVDELDIVANACVLVNDRLLNDAIFSDGKFPRSRMLSIQGRMIKMIAEDDRISDDAALVYVGADAHDAVRDFLRFHDGALADDRIFDDCIANDRAWQMIRTSVNGMQLIM